LLRPTAPKGPRPSMGTTHWITSRGVSIEPGRHWYALYRSARSRDSRDRAGRRKVHAVPDSVGVSVSRYERLRTTEGQGCQQGLSVQSLSGSIGTGCDTIPASVLPGTSSPRWRQGSSLRPTAIVRELRSTPWSFAHHSAQEQDNHTGIRGIYSQARWSLWHSTYYAWEQCSISWWTIYPRLRT